MTSSVPYSTGSFSPPLILVLLAFMVEFFFVLPPPLGWPLTPPEVCIPTAPCSSAILPSHQPLMSGRSLVVRWLWLYWRCEFLLSFARGGSFNDSSLAPGVSNAGGNSALLVPRFETFKADYRSGCTPPQQIHPQGVIPPSFQLFLRRTSSPLVSPFPEICSLVVEKIYAGKTLQFQ